MSYTERDPYGMYRFTSGEKQGPGPELMGAHTLHGEDIYNTKDEDLDDIKEIMLDMRSGRIAYAAGTATSSANERPRQQPRPTAPTAAGPQP